MLTPTITAHDVGDALALVQEFLAAWTADGFIRSTQLAGLAAHVDKRKARWEDALNTKQPLPDDLALPARDAYLDDPRAVSKLWRHHLAALEVRRLGDSGMLSLAQADRCLADLRERTAALRHRLLAEQRAQRLQDTPPPPRKSAQAPSAQCVDVLGEVEVLPPAPRRNFLEILLDPRSIQWLLGSGGALVVLGLVILLWVNKFFTPPVVAVTLAAVNAGLLVGGWGIIRKTRYQTAGRALTLLACLIVPLNLWFLHANQLITLDGHLWVAALVISALYAASALTLRDEMFVYIFVAGITMTGLLILCDLPPSPQRFLEIAMPSTLLVVLGLLAIHVERAFPDQEGPFGRKRFGLAFFWSGHALLGAGLLLVFGAQLAGHWLYEVWFRDLYQSLGAVPSPIVNELRLLAVGLVLAGTYAYIYSDVVVRRVGVYIYLAAAMLLWSEVLIVEELQLQLGIDALIVILAATALVVNIVQATVGKDSKLTRAFPILGLFLGLLPVLLGVFVYLHALSGNWQGVWVNQAPTWSYLGGMLLTAVSCRLGAHLYRHSAPHLVAPYFFATAAATMVGAVALLASLGLTSWQQHAPLLMLIPIVYLVAAQLYRGQPAEQPLVWVGHAATAVMLVSSVASVVAGMTSNGQPSLHLALAGFCAEAALFYGLAAGFRKQAAAVHLATVMACGAVWQVLTYAGVTTAEYYTMTFAVVGLLLLIAYRFAVVERFAAVQLAPAALQSANTLLSLSIVAAMFLGLTRLAQQDVHWTLVLSCLLFGAMSLLAAGLVQQAPWKRWYVVGAIGQCLLAFLAVQVLSTLTPWQKLEVFSVATGLLLLVLGHIGWYREQDRHSDMVSLSLLLGALMAGVPLAIATVIDRYRGQFEGFYILNELGFLTVGILLLLTGVMFRLRSTTLTGGTLTALYFLTLLVLVQWSRLNTVATFIIVGGGVIFTTGLLLSVYRERLLALPDQVKRREGVFRVLGWR